MTGRQSAGFRAERVRKQWQRDAKMRLLLTEALGLMGKAEETGYSPGHYMEVLCGTSWWR